MHGAVPPLLQYAFMARCPVKAQVQLYLYLTGLYEAYNILGTSLFPFMLRLILTEILSANILTIL
jgi:hypothetical protein